MRVVEGRFRCGKMKASLEYLRLLKATKCCGKWMSSWRYRTLASLHPNNDGHVCNTHVPAAAPESLVRQINTLKQTPGTCFVELFDTTCGSFSLASQTGAMPMTRIDDSFAVRVSPDAKTLELSECGKDVNMRFNGTWLRHRCHCPKCKQVNSGQWLFNPATLSPAYTIQSTKLQDENLLIEWNEEPAHITIIPLVFLLSNDYSTESRLWRHKSLEPTVAKGEFPTVEYDEVMRSGQSLLRWLEYLNEYGVCLMKCVPNEKDEIIKVAERIAPIQRTIYGTVFGVESSQNPINVAYSDVALGLHTDLAYYESPPGLQFLHCLRYDTCVRGGESYLVDAWHVAEQMRRQHPQEFATLTRIPATFQKIHLQREWPVYMKYQRPHIVLGPEDQIIAINWSPPFEGPLSVKEEDVEPYFKAYHLFATLLETSDIMLEKHLAEGEMISFNNRRVLHARRGFKLNGGVRHLQGCYINIDEFKSKLEVLSRTIGDARPAKRVFNNCFF
ncbi:Trimethyllysine dioxygenase [Lamellibrachia satsuma]|nr:Trimethyllysine dioxygenase [Lamellibrachia satsuma]